MARRKEGMTRTEWEELLATSRTAYASCVKIMATHKQGLPVHGMAETIQANLKGIAAISVGNDKYFDTPKHSTHQSDGISTCTSAPKGR